MKDSPFLLKIMREGAVNTCRDDVRRVLRLRFGDEAVTELAPALEVIDDLDVLQKLHERAVLCARLEEFRAALPRAKRRR